ncbi:MAG: hypothetical protein ACYTKD_17460 [Planctomycetota bacterium]|jgi:hypothetical protein
MPGKKKGAKSSAAKGGKVSSSKTKPAEKAGPKAATGGKKAPAPKAASAKSGDGAPAKLKAKLNAKKPVDLAPLKAKVTEAKKELTKAENEGNALRAQAKTTEAVAKKAYIKALAPYRDVCRKAGVKCEFSGSRAQNVAPAVHFLVEKVKDGIKVAIKGKAKSEEVIPTAKLKDSIGRAAFEYCERKLGPESQYGKKWAGLSNRLRAAFKAK